MSFSKASFLLGATNFNNLPKSQLAEIAFIGRSNVGKSSLINSITNNSHLAKTSKTPGRTQQINFFQAPKHMIVDLPGYGYASAPKKEAEKWQAFNLEYLQHRKQLRLVVLLVDSRLGIGKLDLEMIENLNQWGVQCQIVYTKSDKLNQSQREVLQSVTQFNDAYPCLSKFAIITSSKTKDGINKLEGVIMKSL